MSRKETTERQRWWRVAYLLGAGPAVIGNLSGVSRQSVSQYLSKIGYGGGGGVLTVNQLRNYRAVYDRFKSHLDFLSPVEAANYIQEKMNGVRQDELPGTADSGSPSDRQDCGEVAGTD